MENTRNVNKIPVTRFVGGREVRRPILSMKHIKIRLKEILYYSVDWFRLAH